MNRLMIDLCAGTIAVAARGAETPGYDARFATFPHYAGDDLGLTVTPSGEARFRLWSPEARQVRLRFYKNGRGGEPLRTIDMERGSRGTWTAAVSPVPYGEY